MPYINIIPSTENMVPYINIIPSTENMVPYINIIPSTENMVPYINIIPSTENMVPYIKHTINREHGALHKHHTISREHGALPAVYFSLLTICSMLYSIVFVHLPKMHSGALLTIMFFPVAIHLLYIFSFTGAYFILSLWLLYTLHTCQSLDCYMCIYS